MASSSGATTSNWTETVEDLLQAGEVDKAISFLESTVCNLENELEKEVQNKNGGNSSFSIANQLAIVLHDLSKLYSAEGFSLSADHALSRALQLKNRKEDLCTENQPVSTEFAEPQVPETEDTTADDWEAIADRAPDELLSPQCLPGVSELSLEEIKDQSTKRRGRGTFSYRKKGLYSDNQSDEPLIDDSKDNSAHQAEHQEKRNLINGTSHVLVLADLPLSTRTTDLEKLVKKYSEDIFVIRWVNDTTALAVFRTPSVALEARNAIQCPFTVRILDEEDELFRLIPSKELEAPRQRPQTSARAAQRLIAQAVGIKLPTMFGSNELREQEKARKNRIVSRQNMRDDAWGDDDNDDDDRK